MKLSCVAALVLLVPTNALAQDARPERTPCSAPEHRQFDFWIGDWEVRRPDGEVAGRNVIEPILGGCALRESWTGAKGMRGTSLNTYSALDGKWHQTWVDEEGTLLLLSGALRDGKMVLEGETPVRHRITWSPLEDGRVRQLWETSPDSGATWNVVFDGTYVPRP
jgi:hypothetical protein